MPSLKLKSQNIKTTEDNFETLPEIQFANYAFGFINLKHRFVPAYVGRTNSNFKDEIKTTFDGLYEQGKRYSHFKFQGADDQMEAYEKECRNYHDYSFRKDGVMRQLDNIVHPTKPNGYSSCPIENCYE